MLFYLFIIMPFSENSSPIFHLCLYRFVAGKSFGGSSNTADAALCVFFELLIELSLLYYTSLCSKHCAEAAGLLSYVHVNHDE